MVVVRREHRDVALLFNKLERSGSVEALLEAGGVVDVGFAHNREEGCEQKKGRSWKSAGLGMDSRRQPIDDLDFASPRIPWRRLIALRRILECRLDVFRGKRLSVVKFDAVPKAIFDCVEIDQLLARGELPNH